MTENQIICKKKIVGVVDAFHISQAAEAGSSAVGYRLYPVWGTQPTNSLFMKIYRNKKQIADQ